MTAGTTDRTSIAQLELHLRRARARVDSASPGGPEFDAAMAALEELEARLIAALSGAFQDAPAVGSERSLAGA